MPSKDEFTKIDQHLLGNPKFRVCDIAKAKERGEGDISSVFQSLKKSDDTVLPQKYADLKRKLIKDPEAFKASWIRLKKALAEGIEEIKEKGSEIIPTIDYSDLLSMTDRKREEVLKRGSLVVKNVIPTNEAIKLKTDAINYIEENPHTQGFPKEKKVVFELYWSTPQIKARSHPNMMSTLAFMNNLWHSLPETEVCLDQNVSYADRLRIRNAGDDLFSLGPHADGGSLERWENEEYSSCYAPIFEGRWEDFDPYDATHRITANMNLHDSKGTCSVFRTFQGWLAVSDIAPKEGTILFAPLVKEVTAYYMLKPFFDGSDQLKLDSEFPGAPPGKSLEFNDFSHPELKLEDIMVWVPKVGPGDMVFWHCDLIHAVDPVHEGKSDSSVFYIPSVPLCQINVAYAFLQREAFLKGLAGPDFPGFPKGIAETNHIGRSTPKDVEKTGGNPAMKEFLLEKFEKRPEYTAGANIIIEKSNDMLFY